MSSSTDDRSAAPRFDWSQIRLVAFDVDGTLYRQAPLRARMAAALGWRALTRLDLKPLKVLRAYRRLREALGEAETPDFEAALVAATAKSTGASSAEVIALVEDWMETRPLPYLQGCAYAGTRELFAAVRASGRAVGVLSDYPVTAKLAALGLSADYAVSAGDTDVGVLKPHPKGLLKLIALAGVRPGQTVLIGDRASRDGLAARAAGAHALILGKEQAGWTTFRRFDDPLFGPLGA